MNNKSLFRLVGPTFIALIAIHGAKTHVASGQEFRHHGKQLTLPDTVSFNAHIRPIMSNTCFACHGPDESVNDSGLRLDSFQAATEHGAIIPGDSSSSPVFERVVDPDDPMPPKEFLHQLTEYEKAIFQKWIDSGAEYQQHWSYTPIARPAVPSVKNQNGVANPVDAFILRRQEQEGIAPTDSASKSTLLRRLHLDLTGIPPTLQELNDFLKDNSATAYEKQVDRLLASPRYGERMATRWLDIVRFSDTAGYHGDQNQRNFPYRDYVINSLNENQPFDEFTKEQLAGDLLKDPTDQQLVATGLIRLNMMTREGGAQPGEYLAKYTADRVRMLGTAWLGATTGCCECHNHKYDPFSIEDFYSLGAFFDDVQQWGVYQNYGYTPNPDLQGYSNEHPFPPELRVESQSLLAQMKHLERKLEQTTAQLVSDDIANNQEFKFWLGSIVAGLNQSSDNWLSTETIQHPANTTIETDGSLLFQNKAKSKQPARITLKPTHEGYIRSIRLQVLPSDTHGGYTGRGKDGRFSVGLDVTHVPAVEGEQEKFVEVKPRYIRISLPGKNVLSLAEVQAFSGDKNLAMQGNASQSSDDHKGSAQLAVDGKTSGVYNDRSTTHTKNENQPWWELDLGKVQSIDRIVVWNRTDKQYTNRLKGFVIELLDENRNPVFIDTPDLASPSIEFKVPEKFRASELLKPEKIAFVQADRFSTNRFRNGYPSPFVEGNWQSGPFRWQLPADEAQLPHTAVYHFNEPIRVSQRDRLVIALNSDDVGKIRFSVSPLSRFSTRHPSITPAFALAVETLAKRTQFSNLSREQSDAVKASWYQFSTSFDRYSSEAKRLRQSIAECRSGFAMTMVSQPIKETEIKQAKVLPRGDWQNDSGKEIQANTPHFLAGYQNSPRRRLTRMDLANWLMAAENPLTARHYVNRTWKHYFGRGLSNVLDDLGNQGEWPSHPALLDWLASEFQQGWDRKKIARLIVTSNTYRQQAAVRKDLQQSDPYNRLFAQQSARRLEAESIRDSILAISGLLQDDWVGGPSVFPNQPSGYYANLQFPNRRYTAQSDGRQYRRGVYMHWQRTFLHPMLANFDAPARDECAADRNASNSPQQALTLLNDPVFVEAARALAARLLKSDRQSTQGKIELAFQLALSREPSPLETNTLLKLYQSQREYFQANADEADKFQRTGQFDTGELNATDHAALAQVCRVLLNLHETITRY